MAKSLNPLVNNLFEAFKARRKSVPDFEAETGIPRDRVYKWKRSGTTPKAEDQKIITDWLSENGKYKGPKNVERGTLENAPSIPAGVVPAQDLISVLKEQNEFLRRNFEISLGTISEGQQQVGIQLKALTWYSALVANKGDQKKADKAISEIHNRIAFYEGVGDGADSLPAVDNASIAPKKKR